MPVRVLGLDLSLSRTGIALWDGCNYTVTHYSSPKKLCLLERLRKIRDHIRRLVNKECPDLVAIETPIFHDYTSEMLNSLYYLVLDAIWSKKIPIVSINNSSLKSMAKARTKTEMIRAVKRVLGNSYSTMVHDEADAFMLAYRAHRFWSVWVLKEELELSEQEKSVFFSEEKTSKGLKKGIVFRRGEFLFLPKGIG